MYIGAWAEYKLATAVTAPGWRDHKKLKEFYVEWQKQCATLGERQATNAIVWGPLFSSLTDGSSPAREEAGTISHSLDGREQNSGPLRSAPHASTRKLPAIIQPRNAHSVSEIFRNGRNQRKTIWSGSQDTPYVKPSVLKVERRRRLHEEAKVRQNRRDAALPAVRAENNPDKIIYADPSRYETAAEREFKSHSLLPSMSPISQERIRKRAERERRHQSNSSVARSGHTRAIPQPSSLDAREQDNQRRPVGVLPKLFVTEKENSHEQDVDINAGFTVHNGQRQPLRGRGTTDTMSYHVQQKRFNVTIDNTTMKSPTYLAGRSPSPIVARRGVSPLSLSLSNVNTAMLPEEQQKFVSTHRAVSPTMSDIENEVDALLDWTDTLQPDRLR